ELPGLSYTAHTLAELRRQHPNAEFWLIIGSDSLADLPYWREPARIVQQAGPLGLGRPRSPRYPEKQLRELPSLSPDVPLRLEFVEGPMIDVSSSDLRQRVGQGRSIRYLVPRAVERYIEEKRIYRDGGGSLPSN